MGPRNKTADHNTIIGYENDALRALASLGISRVIASDLYRLQPLEDISDEITVMADVRSYFQVTYKVRTTVPSLSTFLTSALR